MRTILPPSQDYFVKLFENDSFRKKLKADSTKDEGMNNVSKYYKVEQDWTNYKKPNCMHHTRPENYFIRAPLGVRA